MSLFRKEYESSSLRPSRVEETLDRSHSTLPRLAERVNEQRRLCHVCKDDWSVDRTTLGHGWEYLTRSIDPMIDRVIDKQESRPVERHSPQRSTDNFSMPRGSSTAFINYARSKSDRLPRTALCREHISGPNIIARDWTEHWHDRDHREYAWKHWERYWSAKRHIGLTCHLKEEKVSFHSSSFISLAKQDIRSRRMEWGCLGSLFHLWQIRVLLQRISLPSHRSKDMQQFKEIHLSRSTLTLIDRVEFYLVIGTF